MRDNSNTISEYKEYLFTKVILQPGYIYYLKKEHYFLLITRMLSHADGKRFHFQNL